MIHRIRLRNFRRYSEATLQFEQGLNFIQGRNNVGKTTLFYAIEYAIFGRVENFKTIRSLMQPGKRSLGVEIQFQGKNGERYQLQRLHQMPPKSKKNLEGHFTLKQILNDGERYLLASDFGDTEDKLALLMNELTGLTRRLFSIALHMRQGEIPAILEGSKQLDIVLGVTAASMAEEELRQLALELEKESAGLPVLQERLRSVGAELTKVAAEASSLTQEQKSVAEKAKTLGESADPRLEFERKLTPLNEKLATFEEKLQKAELARQRLADETQRLREAIEGGSKDDVLKELAKIEADAAVRAKKLESLRNDLGIADGEQRKLDAQRGDLAGRIERRKSLPKGKGAKCEVCGSPIKAAETAKELADWSTELEQLEKNIGGVGDRLKNLQSTIDVENKGERATLERASHLTRQRDQLQQLEASVAKREKDFSEASSAEKSGFAAIQSEATTVGEWLTASDYEVRWKLDAEPPAVIASIRDGMQSIRQSLAERVGRQMAERKALAELLERLEGQTQSLQRRQSDLEREQATAQAEANIQEVKAARAERFRGISAGFREFQVQIRTDAATKLAADTIELHRRLSETDEFETLTIDPAHYSVQVTPKDLGEEVPAGLYEGGGHRLLLGLGFRLAVAKLVERCPFLMLDEPTYGLDELSRDALLQRIGTQDFAKQILLVTHQSLGDIPGHRVKVARKDKESVVVEK